MPLQDITVATVIDIKAPQVNIPVNWIKRLTTSDKYAVLLKSHPSMFRIVTTKEPIVTEFYLALTTLEENFLERIFKKIESHKLRPLYSSGVCFMDEQCYYLFFCDGDKSALTESISSALKEIQGVEEVTIRTHFMS